MHLAHAVIPLVVLMLATAAHGETTLVADGQARAIIIVRAEPSPVAEYAAEELAYHVERATGVALPVYAEDAAPDEPGARIHVGATQAAFEAGIDVEALDEEEAVLLTVGEALFIVGDDGDADALALTTRAGTLWGVYELLERDLGVVWMWPGELGTYVPAADTVVLGDHDERFRPHLLQRQVRHGIIRRPLKTQGFTEDGLAAYRHAQEVFLRRHRMGKTYPFRWGHAFSAWWRQYGEEHPEWFQLLEDGRRGPLNETGAWNVSMCVSEPTFHRQIVDLWNEYREAHPDQWVNVNVCENDCSGRCTCPDCQAWDEPLRPGDEDLPVVQRSQSNRYARFWRAVYDLAAQIDPDVMVTAYAYANYRVPPTADIELNENILVGIVPYVTFPLTEEKIQGVRDQWLGWRETGARLFFRPNYTLVGHAMPYAYAHQLADQLHFFFDNGCVATDFDSLPGQWGAAGATMYALCRIHTRPDLPTDDLLGEYYAGFGPAAEHVKAYFDFWEQHTTETLLGMDQRDRAGLSRWSSYASGEHLVYSLAAFDEAKQYLDRAAEAADGEFAERVGFLRLGWEHARRCAEISTLLAGADTRASPLEVYAKLDELAEFRREHEGEFVANFAFAALIEAMSWNIPEPPLREPVRPVAEQVAPLAGEPAFSLRGAHNALALLGDGEHFRAQITAQRLGGNPAPVGWHLIGPDDALLAGGSLQPGESVEIDVEAPAAGLYLLMTQTSRNKAVLSLLNDHAAIAGARLDMLGPTAPMFFYVPEGLVSFSLMVDSQVPENARVALIAPDGTQVAEAETGDEREITMQVEVPAGQDGQAWQAIISPPSVGYFEDYAVTLGPELPPYWSLAPDRLVVRE